MKDRLTSKLLAQGQRHPYATFVIFLLLGLALLRWYLSLKGVVEMWMGRYEISFEFRSFYELGKALVAQEDVYALPYAPYSPISIAFFIPFALPNIQTGWILFAIFNLILLALSIVLSIKILEMLLSRSLTVLEKIAVVAVFLSLGPLRTTFEWGQSNYILLASLLGAWYALKRGRSILSGSLLTIALISKPIPFLLLPYFIWKREVRVVLGSIATFLLLGLISVLAFGWEIHARYASVVAEGLRSPGLIAGGLSLYRYFQSYLPDIAWILVPTLGIFILAATLYATWGKDFLARSFDIEFSLVLIAALLFSPLIHFHHWTWLVPAFLILAFHESDLRMLGLAGIAYAFLAIGWRHSMPIVFFIWLAFMRKYLGLKSRLR